MDILKDSRANCFSVLQTARVSEYISLAEKAYKDKGGLKGQRTALKTKTAIRIRERMKSDIEKGAVLPPIVLGVIVPEDDFKNIKNMDSTELDGVIASSEGPYIIDGMQRTTAFLEVYDSICENEIRLEYWLALNMSSLIYRMLVLNTGQVPWSLRQQIEVVFDSIINELKSKISPLEIFKNTDSRRRTGPGQFQADSVIEFFLAFTTRKEKVDMREELANEFSQSDAIEAMSDLKINDHFIKAMRILIEFDQYFGKNSKSGIDLLSKQPAAVAFIASISQYTFGRPGRRRSVEAQKERWKMITDGSKKFFSKLDSYNKEQLVNFFDEETLNFSTPKSTSQYGRSEREFYLKAFHTLLEVNFDLESLTECWRAY